MTYRQFLQYKGPDIKHATINEARAHIDKWGEITEWKDYLWKSEDRDAFWKAIFWSNQSTLGELKLHTRLSCIRKSKIEWKRFLSQVEPFISPQPQVPQLPE